MSVFHIFKELRKKYFESKRKQINIESTEKDNLEYLGNDNANTNEVYNLFFNYKDSLDVEISIEPATKSELDIFISNCKKYNISTNKVTDLLEYYKLNNNIFNYFKCDDESIFEWYDIEKSLWLGQKDLYTFRYFPEEGKYMVGDASNISFGPDYEFNSITQMLEAFISGNIK